MATAIDSPANLAFASSLEIDAQVQSNVNFLLQLKNRELRRDYDLFNVNNQTLTSLFAMNIAITLITAPFFYFIISFNWFSSQSAYERGTWYFAVVWTPLNLLLIWAVYFHHKRMIKLNNGTLPESSRRFLKYFQKGMFLMLHVVLMYRLLSKTLYGPCADIHAMQGEKWNCNQHGASESVPVETAIAVTLLPMFYSLFVRGAHFEFTILLWALGAACILFSAFYTNARNSILYVLYCTIGSLLMLVEARKLNYFLFFTTRRLQDILQERQREADEVNATEMRHMIANVAHDMKTPLTSFLGGLEYISTVLGEMDTSSSPCSSPSPEPSPPGDLQEGVQSIGHCLASMKATHALMLMTINRCLDFTKASQGLALVPKYTAVDLVEAISQTIAWMHTIQQRVSIVWSGLSPDLPPSLFTDATWLRENLLCLLSNAVKYTQEGDVHVRVTRQEEEKEEKEEKDEKEKRRSYRNFLRIEVQDHGVGLSDDVIEMLSTPAKQASRLSGGTGLGLYCLTKRLEALQGRWGVDTPRDGTGGCLFWILLPFQSSSERCEEGGGGGEDEERRSTVRSVRSSSSPSHSERESLWSIGERRGLIPGEDPGEETKEEEEEVKPRKLKTENFEDTEGKTVSTPGVSPPPSPRMATSSPTSCLHGGGGGVRPAPLDILLVDDSPSILKLTSLMLSRHGHTVTTAIHGAEALDHIHRRLVLLSEGGGGVQKPLFDVVLMDLQMPVLDGPAATRQLRQWESLHWQTAASLPPRTDKLTIIGISASSDPTLEAEAIQTGLDAFIPKPFSLDVFYATWARLQAAGVDKRAEV